MKLNVRTKLIGGFLLVVAMLLVVFGISYNGLTSMAAATDHIVHEALPEVEEVADLELQLALQTELYFEYALTLDDAILEEARKQTDKIHEESAQLEEQLAGEPEMLNLLLKFEDEYEEFLAESEVFAAHYRAGETAEGLEALHIMVVEEMEMEEDLAELAHLIDLGIEESFAAAESTEKSAIQLIVAVSIIATATALIIGFLLSRSISNGVTSVGRALQRIAVGDVTAQVDVSSSDEIGAMADSYREMQEYLTEVSESLTRVGEGDLTVEARPRSENDALGNAMSLMIASMRSLIGDLGNTSTGLATASSQLSSAAEQAGQATSGITQVSQQVAQGASQQTESTQAATEAMQQLSNAIDQITSGSEEQSRGVEQATNIVGQVSTAIADVARNALEATEGSNQTSEAAKSGAEMVDQTIEGMGKISAAMDEASSQIAQLGTQSEEIGKIVAVIDDIAAQTNLLALNAAIEAAEEGTKEVAEGVKLAEEAGRALTNITESVEGVTRQIEQISASAEEVSASSDEMVKTMDGVSSVTEQNSAASEQMAANSTEVFKSVESITAVSEQNSAATQEMSASAEEMSAQVQEVVASTQDLDNMAKTLQQAVAAFKLDTNTAENGVAPRESEEKRWSAQRQSSSVAVPETVAGKGQ